MGKNPLAFFWADCLARLPNRRYLDLQDRPRRLRAQVFCLAALASGSVYLVWVARLALRNQAWQDYLFLLAESLSFLLLALLAFDSWHLRGHHPEGLRLPRHYSVDVFVPCCGEPLEVVSTTLRAIRRISYEPMEVYVLDDGANPQVDALAQSLGFHYLSRPRSGLGLKDAKSGNLNFGLQHSQGELVLVMDADQVPVPEILARLAGFFRLPRVAYVQSKQAFLLPEGDPFYNCDLIFYETLQLANDQANAVVSCGSGVIYRRQALEEMGGFATWNLVEDFTTSYELVSRGWKGIYFPYALSRGLAPTTLAGVYRQRFQWCLDTMRLFFWDNPCFKRGLTWSQRCHFLTVMLSYLMSGLVFPVFYSFPLIVYWQGYTCFRGHEISYWLLRAVYLAATISMFRYLFYGKEPLKQFKMLCSLFPVHTGAIFAALLYPPRRKPSYRTNNLTPFAEQEYGWQIAPHLVIISLHLALPFLSLWQGWASPRLIVFNAVFSAFIIWVLGDLVLAAIARPVWHPAVDPKRVYG
jgi:cellulose synthase (UDP-forming)